jgi:hypothetical protein
VGIGRKSGEDARVGFAGWLAFGGWLAGRLSSG